MSRGKDIKVGKTADSVASAREPGKEEMEYQDRALPLVASCKGFRQGNVKLRHRFGTGSANWETAGVTG